MDEDENVPILISTKTISGEFNKFHRIPITTENFTLGRALKHSVSIPYISISRDHCAFKKIEDNRWVLEDNSSFGIVVNNEKLGKGVSRKLGHQDVICLEPSEQFVYKFIHTNSDVFEIPKKRRKRGDECVLKDVKLKFEESQNSEIKHIAEKIQNTKQLQNTSIIMKEQLEQDMDRRTQQLKRDFALQIENLNGEKNEVEKQKALLIEERDAQLNQVKNVMEGKIAELMEQIQKHNETESDLMKENNSLKEKLDKERKEFLSELSRESSSKQDMLEKLKEKVKEQEEVMSKEKEQFEELLKRETEQLRIAKEKELQELEEQKRHREQELEQELFNIKKNLSEQVEQTKEQRRQAEEFLILQMEQMKKLIDEEKIKMSKLLKEREEIKIELEEAQKGAEASIQDLQKRVQARETELAAVAAERIQVQADQSSVVITTLQEQLENVKNQLQSVETEKNTLLESIFTSDDVGEGTSKQNALNEVGEIMESELQCSICAELFIEAMTLNCSHTFCKYCISMWKKKKKDCPICRSSITSECRSLVLDTFIEKMVQNLTKEMKTKREDLLKFRAELVSEMARQTAGTSRGSFSADGSEDSEGFDDGEGYDDEYVEEEEDYYNNDDYDSFWPFRRRYYDEDESSDTDSGSDDGADTDQSFGAASNTAASRDGVAGAAGAAGAGAAGLAGASGAGLAAASGPPGVSGASGLPNTGQTVMVVRGDGAVASPASPASTTAATDGASTAAPADTGPQGALTGFRPLRGPSSGVYASKSRRRRDEF